MTVEDLLDSLETLADAPGGIDHLRELVLRLAVRGRLVAQQPTDEPADALLEQLEAGRARMIEDGVINKPRHPIGEPVEVAPFRIPHSWAWLRIGDVGAVVGGGTPEKDALFWADGHEIPWLTPADMRGQDSRYVFRGARDITLAGLRASSAQLLPAGSVLFSSRAPIGHVGIAAQALTTNQGFKSCVPYVSDLAEYIYLYLREAGPAIHAAASGTTFKEVSGKEVARVPIPIPPVAEQRRIVARVDELTALLDRLEAAKKARDATRAQLRNAALAALQDANDPEEVKTAWSRIANHMHDLFTGPSDIPPLRRSVLRLAVRGMLVSQDADEEPSSVQLEQIEADDSWRIPERARRTKMDPVIDRMADPLHTPLGWSICRIGDCAQLINGRAYKQEELLSAGTPVIRIQNLNGGQSWYYSDLELPDRQYCDAGDLLFAWSASFGPYLWDGGRAIYHYHIWKLNLSPAISKGFAYLLLSDLTEAVKAKSHGLAMLHMTKAKMERWPLALPPLAEQKRIVKRTREVFALLDRLESSLVGEVRAQEAFSASAVRALPQQAAKTPENRTVTVG